MLVYVLCNGRKHLPRVGYRLRSGWIDDFSSGAWFQGWIHPPPPQHGPARSPPPGLGS